MSFAHRRDHRNLVGVRQALDHTAVDTSDFADKTEVFASLRNPASPQTARLWFETTDSWHDRPNVRFPRSEKRSVPQPRHVATTSSVAWSVTRRPRTKFGSIPASAKARLIALPPPWTTHRLHPHRFHENHVQAGCASGPLRRQDRLPPSLMTVVFPRNRRIHPIASISVSAFAIAWSTLNSPSVGVAGRPSYVCMIDPGGLMGVFANGKTDQFRVARREGQLRSVPLGGSQAERERFG